MATKTAVNEFVDPDLGRMVAVQETRNCNGCAYEKLRCPVVDEESPACVSHQRKDNRNIIWVLAQNVPKAVKLTDEQIDKIEAAHWSGPGLGATFAREAFARAIEAAVLKANGLGDRQ